MTTSSEEARALQHSDTPARAPGDRHTQLTDGDQHTASASALAGSNDDNAVRAKAFESIGPEEFASIIFGDAFTPDRRLVVSRFGPDGSSAWCSSPEQAAQVVQAIDAVGNVYMGCCLMRAAAEAPGKRGSSEDTVAMGAVWADVDVGTEGHSADKNYPPTLNEALDHMARRIEQRPSIIVETGGGAHLWWLLDEPLIFETEADRACGAELVQRWQLRIRQVWAEKGWDLDSAHDLARVLRPPRTRNHKHNPPRPVRVTAWDVI